MRRVLPILFLTACGYVNAEGEPLVEAHRAAAGYWPDNSRLAVVKSLEHGYDGIEIDLVLSADEVPILVHEPFLTEEECTLIDGRALQSEVAVRDLTAEQLTSNFLCGGAPDPDHPNATVLAETLVDFDEFLELLGVGPPGTLVHLDLKVEDDLTLGPHTTADAVLSRWFAADRPNPFYVSANTAEAIEAIEMWGDVRGRNIPTSLIWPFHPTGGSVAGTGLKATIGTTFGANDLVKAGLDAGADGVAVNHELVDRHMVRSARGAGLSVGLWTVNDKDALEHYTRWPVDSLITDYPEDLP